MDLATATPVEIDTELAAILAKTYATQAKAASKWAYIARLVHFSLRLPYNASPYPYQVNDFLRDAYSAAPNDRTHDQQYAVKAHEDMLNHQRMLDTLKRSARRFDEEYERRGGWTRAFLVSNSNGHVHSSMSCSTCRPSTQYHWITEMSDHAEEEIVEKAGERACTVCFPSAPVEVLSRPTQFFTPDEQAAQEAKAAREAKKAEKKAAEITVEGFYDYGDKPITKVFKSERAVTNEIAARLSRLCAYGASHPDAWKWSENVSAALYALRERGIEYDYDKALANARKRITREGGSPKF